MTYSIKMELWIISCKLNSIYDINNGKSSLTSLVACFILGKVYCRTYRRRWYGYGGQVPHTGLLAFVSAEIVAKSAGSAAILVTHQLVKSWLNELV